MKRYETEYAMMVGMMAKLDNELKAEKEERAKKKRQPKKQKKEDE